MQQSQDEKGSNPASDCFETLRRCSKPAGIRMTVHEIAAHSRSANAGHPERLLGMQRVRDLSRDSAARAAQQFRTTGSPSGLLQACRCLSVASEPSIFGRPPSPQPPGMLQVRFMQTSRVCPCSTPMCMWLLEESHAQKTNWCLLCRNCMYQTGHDSSQKSGMRTGTQTNRANIIDLLSFIWRSMAE